MTLQPQKSLSPRALAQLLALALIWGASFLSIRLALDEVSVLSSVLHRVFWAVLVLWAVLWWQGQAIPRGARIWGAFAVMGLLNNVIPFLLMAWAQLHIESGLTSILNATTALFGVLVAAIFLGDERLTARKLGGVMLGMVGVVVVIGPQVLLALDLLAGAQLAVLGGTLSYAFAAAWARRRLSHLSPMQAATGMLTTSTVVLLIATFIWEGGVDMPNTLTGTLAIAYYALIATAGAYMLYYRVLASAGASNVMLVTLIIPPIAILLGALVLDERLDWGDFAGFALVGGALLILQGGRKKPLVRADRAV